MVAARPLRALDASVARHQKSLAVVPRTHTLQRANAHPAATAVDFAGMVQSTSPITQNVGARDLEVHFPLPGRCLLYTSDAADDLLCVDLGGRRIIKKKK